MRDIWGVNHRSLLGKQCWPNNVEQIDGASNVTLFCISKSKTITIYLITKLFYIIIRSVCIEHAQWYQSYPSTNGYYIHSYTCLQRIFVIITHPSCKIIINLHYFNNNLIISIYLTRYFSFTEGNLSFLSKLGEDEIFSQNAILHFDPHQKYENHWFRFILFF